MRKRQVEVGTRSLSDIWDSDKWVREKVVESAFLAFSRVREPMRGIEIWDWVRKSFRGINDHTTENAFRQYLSNESKKEDGKIIRVVNGYERRRKRKPKKSILEKDTYEPLGRMIAERLAVQTYVVANGTRSGEKGAKQWSFPDIVGYKIVVPLDRSALDLYTSMNEQRAVLYSFEVKVRISRAELKQCIFQAVSNSLWAHKGFLVVWEKPLDSNIDESLRSLCARYNIGLMYKDGKSVTIEHDPRGRDVLEWEAVDEISSGCKRFADFLQNVGVEVRGPSKTS